MTLEERLKKPRLNEEPYFYVNSEELESNISYLKKNRIENLMLIPNEGGYKLNNVDFFKELPFLKKVKMGACNKLENYNGLIFLKDLEHLSLSSNKNISLDLTNLTNLKELYFTFTPKITGLDKLINLEVLSVSSGTDTFLNLEIFRNYRNLKKLMIYLTIINDGLTFLKENIILEYLEFNYMKRSFSVKGIEYLKESLKKLKFISSKKVDDIHLVSKLENLEWLILSESVKLENTEILKTLKKLEAFTMYGSSSFVDGNLRSLKDVRDNIKHYKVQNKKHYFYE